MLMSYGANPISGRLKTERKKRGWDIPRMAVELRKASDQPGKLPNLLSLQRNIERWEAGQVTKISERYRLLYAAAFDIPDSGLFPPTPTGRTASDTADDDDMERRKLLGSLVALGAATSPALDALNEIQGSVERILGTDANAHLDDWEETLAEYGYTFPATPKAQIIPELATDLVTVRATMGRIKPTGHVFRSWCRIMAGLSMLLAKALSGEHRPREARTWWTTAQQAADASGDVDLSLWVSGEQLIHGLYERRPVPILLRRADDVVERAGDVTHRGFITVLAARAQLLALDGGRPGEAERALQQTAALFAELPSSITSERRSLVGWGEDRLRYTETFVHAHQGDADLVTAAAARALELIPRDQRRFRTQLELLHGFGLVRSGDVTEGVRHAQGALESDPGARSSLMSATIAGDVLDAVPAAARREPLVVGYRELLSGDSRRAIT